MPEALKTLIGIVVGLVLVMRVIMRSDLPDWGKQFIAALIVFGLQIIMTIIVVLLVWILEASGLGKLMVGRALVLSRLHILGKMGQFTATCMGNQLAAMWRECLRIGKKGTRAASAQPSFNYGLDGERRGGYVASKNAGAVAPS